MTRHLLRLSSLVLVITLLAGCGLAIFNPPTKLTVGDELNQLGLQFLDTAKMYDAALGSGAITKTQYNAFAEFATYFKLGYIAAAKAYESGTKSPSELRSTIRELTDELTLYALSQIKK